MHWVFKVTLWAVFYEQVLAHGLLPVLRVRDTLEKHPLLVQRQCTAWEPGVPTLARVMQVWLMYPCGTNWSLQGSHRHARIQLGLKPCNDLAPLALISPGRIWICSNVYSLVGFPLLITRSGMMVPWPLLHARNARAV